MFVFFKVIIFLFPSDAILLITIFIFITRAKYFWEWMIHLGLLGTIWQWMKFKSTDIFILSLSWISFPGRCSFIIYGSPLLFSADNFISLYFPRGSPEIRAHLEREISRRGYDSPFPASRWFDVIGMKKRKQEEMSRGGEVRESHGMKSGIR